MKDAKVHMYVYRATSISYLGYGNYADKTTFTSVVHCCPTCAACFRTGIETQLQ